MIFPALCDDTVELHKRLTDNLSAKAVPCICNLREVVRFDAVFQIVHDATLVLHMHLDLDQTVLLCLEHSQEQIRPAEEVANLLVAEILELVIGMVTVNLLQTLVGADSIKDHFFDIDLSEVFSDARVG